MRVILQRSKEASVTVNGEQIGAIEHGLVLLVGITHEDTETEVNDIVEKVINLRIFEDEDGKMNLSLVDTGGSILSISQFTLYGDTKKGRRPSFTKAAKPDVAEVLYDQFNASLLAKGIHVETGRFGADMKVQLVNDGPVTLIVEK
ncbi:D-aminoacyl-tRNA deacylase [Alkalicoccobacillus murimartini]|uniref:D-aminoacyl-tRNA deacylase n=1 Tax=Alkalicoccobacillus murimartini TaxID=171685 RepID=A0ABT9YC38_9BACI|nr:D-aminoacyl-tRNA deacylase [Alkalicoccobacillus murimartini]MDQ0205413.1 D-tyrosyl-tRNA(Tyr) deacylase [Alkalicoccobacillus murimartini]